MIPFFLGDVVTQTHLGWAHWPWGPSNTWIGFPCVPKLLLISIVHEFKQPKHGKTRGITENLSFVVTLWFQSNTFWGSTGCLFCDINETRRLLLPHRRGWWQILSTLDQCRLQVGRGENGWGRAHECKKLYYDSELFGPCRDTVLSFRITYGPRA